MFGMGDIRGCFYDIFIVFIFWFKTILFKTKFVSFLFSVTTDSANTCSEEIPQDDNKISL